MCFCFKKMGWNGDTISIFVVMMVEYFLFIIPPAIIYSIIRRNTMTAMEHLLSAKDNRSKPVLQHFYTLQEYHQTLNDCPPESNSRPNPVMIYKRLINHTDTSFFT